MIYIRAHFGEARGTLLWVPQPFQQLPFSWLFTVHSTSPLYLWFTCPSVPSLLSSSTVKARPVLLRIRHSFPTFASTLICLLNHARNTSAAGRLAGTLHFTRLHFADTLLYTDLRSVATLLSTCLSLSLFNHLFGNTHISNPPASAKNNWLTKGSDDELIKYFWIKVHSFFFGDHIIALNRLMSCKCHFCVHWVTKNSHDALLRCFVVVVWNQTPNIFGYAVFDLTFIYFLCTYSYLFKQCTSAVMLWVQDL